MNEWKIEIGEWCFFPFLPWGRGIFGGQRFFFFLREGAEKRSSRHRRTQIWAFKENYFTFLPVVRHRRWSQMPDMNIFPQSQFFCLWWLEAYYFWKKIVRHNTSGTENSKVSFGINSSKPLSYYHLTWSFVHLYLQSNVWHIGSVINICQINIFKHRAVTNEEFKELNKPLWL